MSEATIKVPDIGGASHVDVIEVLVSVGDLIEKETSLVTLETDKASMEIPSPIAGKVKSILLKVGDKVSEGDVIVLVDVEGEKDATPTLEKPAEINSPAVKPEKNESAETSSAESVKSVNIPDIGGATLVDVIEILVKPGDEVLVDSALVTLEGDKATMDIPSPMAGKVVDIAMSLGDKVSMGDLILTLQTRDLTNPVIAAKSAPDIAPDMPLAPKVSAISPVILPSTTGTGESLVSGAPSVRRLARELGVNLALVKGSGRKSRVTKEDIAAFVKTKLTEQPSSAGGFNYPKAPVIDFSKFGEIEVRPLNKIKRLTGQNVHRAWVSIPHVTQFDEADITELEAFRKAEAGAYEKSGVKLTLLAFVCKVVSKALAIYPQFNASLDQNGDNLIYKRYCHLGIAVETPNGLVVPVIKDVDKLSITEIAKDMARLSSKARDKGLSPLDMSGGCFTISSLGGIGGTAFTPIVNSPEVAILGLSRSSIKPVFEDNEFKPRLMLPLSLSYDHRVIDGAEAARFTRYIADALKDVRRILL